jgi:hypothetical protein
MIDALWGRCPVLSNWEVMTDLALNPSTGIELTDSGTPLVTSSIFFSTLFLF